ncbi:hypothetical protein ACIGO9_35995 [Nocardia asteroides]|uniref:hypothetical protein n=1 Tax=Nocardia asteroides TaxID=1824 RepID=UPI0037C52DC8
MSDASTMAPEWAERVERAGSAVTDWYDWLRTPHPAEPSSALYGDDLIHAKQPVRNMAWQGLISATDNLGLLVDSLTTIGARPVAHFTLARASLFAASRTVWILHPPSRRTRQERALWVAFEDVRNLKNLIECASANDPTDPGAVASMTHVETEIDELKQVALTKLGLTLNSNGKPKDTDIVTEAAEYLDPSKGDVHRGIMMFWRIHSGHAHGLSWPNLLKRPPSTFTGPDGQTYNAQTPDHTAIAEAVAAATVMTNKAFTLYDERATSHLGEI